MDDKITCTNKSVSIVTFSELELALEVSALPSPFADHTTRESLQTGKECEYEELRFRRGSPLACGIMGSVCSSLS